MKLVYSFKLVLANGEVCRSRAGEISDGFAEFAFNMFDATEELLIKASHTPIEGNTTK